MRSRLIGLAVLLGVAATAWCATRSGTPAIRGSDGRVLPQSIASLERVRLGGVDQWILIRGRDRANPVILFLHGGPGMPAMYLAHAFQRDLEADFTVVHWDRRGAGKSYSASVPPASMAISQQLADTLELVRLLRARLGQPRVYLVGHSFGSVLGLLASSRHPELFHAYIGIGQVVDEDAARALQLRFVTGQASARRDAKALEDIRRNGRKVLEEYLFRYGAELHGATSWWPLLRTGMQAPEYSWTDVLRVPRGVSFSHAHTTDDVLRGTPPGRVIRTLDVPVWFFAGRYDYVTPSVLVARYFEELRAPRKALVWFDHSAHFPFLEEPARFAAEMKRVRREIEHKDRAPAG